MSSRLRRPLRPVYHARPVSQRRQGHRGGPSAEGTGRRESQQEQQQVIKNKKKSAIVRVCQLRMIVWLVEPPPVSSADGSHTPRPATKLMPGESATGDFCPINAETAPRLRAAPP